MEGYQHWNSATLQSYRARQPAFRVSGQVPCPISPNVSVLPVRHKTQTTSAGLKLTTCCSRYNRVIDLLGKASCSCAAENGPCGSSDPKENILTGVGRACSNSSFSLTVRPSPVRNHSRIDTTHLRPIRTGKCRGQASSWILVVLMSKPMPFPRQPSSVRKRNTSSQTSTFER